MNPVLKRVIQVSIINFSLFTIAVVLLTNAKSNFNKAELANMDSEENIKQEDTIASKSTIRFIFITSSVQPLGSWNQEIYILGRPINNLFIFFTAGNEAKRHDDGGDAESTVDDEFNHRIRTKNDFDEVFVGKALIAQNQSTDH